MRSQAKASSVGSTEGRGGRSWLGRTRAFGLVVSALLLSGLLASTAAPAATVYRPTGEATAGGSTPTQLAVDAATGAIFLANRSQGKIDVLAPAGGSPALETSFGEGELVGPAGVAIDQSARTVYVTDGVQGKIFKYDISGSGPLTITPDPNFTSPAHGVGPGELFSIDGAPFAVDPTNGDLLVADLADQQVNRFAPDGSFISSFDGTGSLGGRFHNLSGLAVDTNGLIYVVDLIDPRIQYEYGRSVVERFAASGQPDSSFAPAIPTPRTVAVDLSSDNVIVAGRSDGYVAHEDGTPPYPPRLYVLHGGEVIDEQDLSSLESDFGAIIRGIAGGGASKRLYVAVENFAGVPPIRVFDALQAPDLLLDEPSDLTTTGAHVSGTVDPLGDAATYHFEYSREGGPTQETEELPLPAGVGPQAVEADLSGLLPNSEYALRLVATDTASGATISTQPRRFTTVAAVPRVTTGEAYDRTLTSATVAGKLNPLGQQTNYWFEYGLTAAYGMRTPFDHGEVAGAGREALAVQGYLFGLQQGTEYHYRLVAENATGVTVGADRTFTTKSVAAPPRIYEQVSPVAKGGSNVNGLRGMNVSPDGSHLMYEWKTPPAGSFSAPAFPRSSATRTPLGWTAQSLDAPQIPGSSAITKGIRVIFTLGISEDGSKAVTDSLQALAPGATESASNLYLRDSDTGELTTLASTPGINLYGGASNLGHRVVIDGTPNYSHVLLVPLSEPLLPGASATNLYDYTDGQLHVVSLAPDGSPLGSVEVGAGTSANEWRDRHYISDDGSKIFFQAGGETYVRLNDESTVKIGGNFCGASRDGHYAFVFGRDLTSDSETEALSLYRFDTATQATELLGRGGNCLQVSLNGQSVFFSSGEALTPDAAPGGSNVYVWRNGETKLVANLAPGNRGGAGEYGNGEYMSSDSGRYFAFGAYGSLTGYDNSTPTACIQFNNKDPQGPEGKGVACAEIYRFDADTGQLTCASCRRDGESPLGNARIGTDSVEGHFRFQRSMLDDGTVIFDTTDPLSARDSNSNRDVYTYDGTEATLVSSGFENSRAEFDGASADGRDVFFTTQDQLVGQDTDTLADVYDARINGGIPGQNPPPPRPECIRDDCKATPPGGPELPFGGSEGLNGPQNVHVTATRRHCAKGTKARKVKGKSRCVKQRKSQHKNRAKSNRRQGR